jgi:predicted small metal-binding protein
MRKLSCNEAGDPTCNFVASGQTDDDVIQEARQHALEVHHHQITPDEEEQARAIIRSA